MSGSFPINGYSPFKEYYSIVPANSQSSNYTPTNGVFRKSRLEQTPILRALQEDPVDEGHLLGPYDVSIKEKIEPLWPSVGQVIVANDHIASCTLISHNLALVPCHCIEGLDVRNLQVIFGRAEGITNQAQEGYRYNIMGIVECDQTLDYAIIKLDGTPGKNHAYLPVNKHHLADSPPALLHYPLGKPLQISIHAVVQSSYQQTRLETFHDTQYGSSGGAYINPSGVFVAMHLGSQRNTNTYNLLRLALPINEIIENHPNGILSRFNKNKSSQNSSSNDEILWYGLDKFYRDFIDFEVFDKNLFSNDFYVIRQPKPNAPGFLIDPGQNKHTEKWPTGERQGKRGTCVLNCDDTVLLGELIAKESYFITPQTANIAPKNFKWDLTNLEKKTTGNELFKKLKPFKEITCEIAFDLQSNTWQAHFFPK